MEDVFNEGLDDLDMFSITLKHLRPCSQLLFQLEATNLPLSSNSTKRASEASFSDPLTVFTGISYHPFVCDVLA